MIGNAIRISVILVLLAPVQAAAAILDLGNVTRDTDSGLDWLDLTETTGLSVADILADVGGFASAGWRHATEQEICNLTFMLLGLSPCPGSVAGSGDFSATGAFLSLLGATDPNGFCGSFVGIAESSIGIYDGASPGIGDFVYVARVTNGPPLASYGVVGSMTSTFCSPPPLPAVVGHFLVRASPPSTCGNGMVDPGEQCDDGGTASSDGCSSACAIEDGWSCVGEPSTCSEICGDSLIVGDEECDFGDTNDGDCCSASCRFQEADPGGAFGGTPNCCVSGVCQVSQACGQVCFLAGECAVLGDGTCRCVGVAP